MSMCSYASTPWCQASISNPINIINKIHKQKENQSLEIKLLSKHRERCTRKSLSCNFGGKAHLERVENGGRQHNNFGASSNSWGNWSTLGSSKCWQLAQCLAHTWCKVICQLDGGYTLKVLCIIPHVLEAFVGLSRWVNGLLF